MFKKLSDNLLNTNGFYSIFDKIAILISLVVLIFLIPVSYIPTVALKNDSDIDKVLTDRYLYIFNHYNIEEVSLNNLHDLIRKTCASRQTFVNNSPRFGHTDLSFWRDNCTQKEAWGDFDYSFRLINVDGKKIKFYSTKINNEIKDYIISDKRALSMYITQPIKKWSNKSHGFEEIL